MQKRQVAIKKKFGIGLVEDDVEGIKLSELVSSEELDRLGENQEHINTNDQRTITRINKIERSRRN